jgi:galactonate dehydratase
MTTPNNEVRPRRRMLGALTFGLLGPGVRIGRGNSAASAWTGTQTNSVLNQARCGAMSLKIARVTPLILRIPKSSQVHFLLCRIDTEDGLTGWGEGTHWPLVADAATEIELVKRHVIGQSAFDIEKIWRRVSSVHSPSYGASLQSAVSAIDIALWDLVGQALGVPVYKLLGGKVNDKVKFYKSFYPSRGWTKLPRTSEAYAKLGKELAAAGVVAGKFMVPAAAGANRQVTLETVNQTVAMVRGLREGAPNLEICLEGSGRFNVAAAVRIAKAVEPYSPLFFEEPVPEHVDAYLQVQQATSVPLAGGERLKSRLEAMDFIERGALRVFQPDAARCGGITEFRKMVAMAEAHLIPLSPHNPNGPVCLAAHLHLAASSPSFLMLEEGYTDPALCRELFGEWKQEPAHFPVPERPGLGISLPDAFVREHSVDIDKAERN